MPPCAGKGYLYEGGIREPLIVRWPGVIRPGSVGDVPVSSIDFYPTIMDMAGSRTNARPLDGVSIVPLLRQRSSEWRRQDLYWHYPHYSNQGGKPSGAVRSGDFKLIEFFEDGRLELYNLREDLGEQTDLAARMPEKTKELHARLLAWRSSVAAQMPAPNPDYQPHD